MGSAVPIARLVPLLVLLVLGLTARPIEGGSSERRAGVPVPNGVVITEVKVGGVQREGGGLAEAGVAGVHPIDVVAQHPGPLRRRAGDF